MDPIVAARKGWLCRLPSHPQGTVVIVLWDADNKHLRLVKKTIEDENPFHVMFLAISQHPYTTLLSVFEAEATADAAKA